MAAPVIPEKQWAAVVSRPGPDSRVELREIDVPVPGEDEVLVKISYSGLCFSDVHLIKDDWPACSMTTPIPGHEDAGRVVLHGSPSLISSYPLHTRVGLKWVAYPCATPACICTDGLHETYCPPQSNFGRDVSGTFAQYVVAKARYLTLIPEGVSDEDAAPLLCGGLTAYASVLKAGGRRGEWLVVLEPGGGLGHLAVQYGVAMGMRAVGIDKGEKEAFVRGLGAEGFFDFREERVVEKVVERCRDGGGVKGVSVCSSGFAGYETAVRIAGVGGTVVCVGIPATDTPIPAIPRDCIIRDLTIRGTNCGTLLEADEVLRLTAEGKVKPLIVPCEMSDLNDMVDQLLAGKSLRARRV